MTAVCIAGMHRSGTSMVTRLMNICGLHLGAQWDMNPTQPDNPEGYWENIKFVTLNDELLAELGGGWDYPPQLAPDWPETDKLARLRRKACVVVDDFRDCDLWGWKDPRSSLLVPFWCSVQPDLKFVICLRNPLEVADSLYRRNMFSRARSLALWREYNERVLAATRPGQRIITHYYAYFVDVSAEVGRVLQFVGASPRPEQLERCTAAVHRDLRHNRAYAHQLLDPGVPADVFDLYATMCEEAGWRESPSDGVLPDMRTPDQTLASRGDSGETSPERLRTRIQELEVELAELKRDATACHDQLAQRAAEIDGLQRQLTAVHSSNSWRITAPLRAISGGVAGQALRRRSYVER
jgi:hypothetical protein